MGTQTNKENSIVRYIIFSNTSPKNVYNTASAVSYHNDTLQCINQLTRCFHVLLWHVFIHRSYCIQ